MSDVYVADHEHYCSTPERHSRPVGSIWKCDDCGTYFVFGYTDESWGPVWWRVRWWNFRVRRKIRNLT